MEKRIPISTPTITLGQFLKLAGIIDTGGQAKWFLQETGVKVNGEPENRRGKKLVPGDKLNIEGVGHFEIVEEN